jgi:pimeloyl-ACP methyl ester carboxylesterase
VPRYVIENEGAPLSSGTGLFVFNPPEAGTAYYAVARSERGVENSRVEGNVTGAVSETVGRGTPVLQRVEEPDQFQFIEGSTLHYYVRWETSPNSAVEGKPFDYLVAVPRGVRYPAPVGIHLHGWGGSMTRDYGWWFNAERGAILVASNQEPYDWWTGYHEQLWSGTLGTPEAWQAGVVRPYTERRLFSFVDWLATERELDLPRLFTAGNSMGGSGALMLAIRNPQRVAWSISWVGVHVPLDSPTFRSSYELVFGDPAWNVRFEDGTPVWDHYSDAWYLRQHPDQDVGFLTFSNGKNDDSIGWAQAVDFIRALQDTRQPHLFVWGQQGHGQRAVMPGGGDGEHRVMPIDLTTDQSLPAFSRSTLDDDPGDGSPDSGAPAGQINRFLTWDTDSIVDEAGRWSIEISVIDNGPASEASVDVTPRRLQQLRVTPGDVFAWTNTRGRQVVQQGEVVADEWGLVTVPQVRVTRGGNRLSINRR